MGRSVGSVAAAILMLGTVAARAHEYWIEPESHTLAPGEALVADMKVGQDFAGAVFPYLSHRFVEFTVTDRAGQRPYRADEGDVPSIRIGRPAEGLVIIGYLSTADSLTFDGLDEFEEYVAYEGNDWAVAAHLADGLPPAGFSELYTRCAKALVQVGPPEPGEADRAIGLPLELVALGNPFAAKSGTLEVKLLWQGAPLPDVQVAAFRAGDPVERRTYRTDWAGRVSIDLGGGGRFLLSAVRLARLHDRPEAVWQSHWASLTFSAP